MTVIRQTQGGSDTRKGNPALLVPDPWTGLKASRRDHDRATKKCLWPFHDQLLFAAAFGGVTLQFSSQSFASVA